MHRCTVDGCTMMFSSRRSRNRHSANPNPKLHLPQTIRRKLPDSVGGLGVADSASGEFEDDDEESGSAYPASPMSLSSQYAMRCAAAAVHHTQIVLDDDDDDDDVASTHSSTAVESVSTAAAAAADDTLAAGFSAAVATTAPSTPSSETALNLVCSPRSASSLPSGGGSGNAEHGTAETAGAGGGQTSVRGTSKRKSAVPTRCSAQQQDDDVISDDNSCSDAPATKRRSVEPTTSTDEEKSSAAAAEEPNNNKVGGEQRADESEESGTADAAGAGGSAAPRSSTPADAGPESPSAILSDDVSSIGSDDERRSAKDGADGDAQHGAAELEISEQQRQQHEDEVNDSGVVVDRAEPVENGTAAGAKDPGVVAQPTAGFVCLVEGCNATFPSKRSRDRHSANLNLHRKLLSTSGTSKSTALYSDHPFPPAVVDADEGCLVLNLSRSADGPETRASAAAAAAAAAVAEPPDADTDGEASRSSCDEPTAASGGDGDPTAAMTCHVCPAPTASFRDRLALKEHLEAVHPREAHRCTVPGCDKLFSTRKSRNRHSQNDNLHRHLAAPPVTSHAPAVNQP